MVRLLFWNKLNKKKEKRQKSLPYSQDGQKIHHNYNYNQPPGKSEQFSIRSLVLIIVWLLSCELEKAILPKQTRLSHIHENESSPPPPKVLAVTKYGRDSGWRRGWMCGVGVGMGGGSKVQAGEWTLGVSERRCHTPSIAFRHIPPNSARFSYATEGALFISAQLFSAQLNQVFAELTK